MRNCPWPSFALPPSESTLPPTMTVGSAPECATIEASMLVVVVLPWVPATATPNLRRISSASISARWTMGTPWRWASSTSGLSRPTADEMTTTLAPERFSARWPTAIFTPSSRSLRTVSDSVRSEPETGKPWRASTSAMPLMPMPPMPMKWTCCLSFLYMRLARHRSFDHRLDDTTCGIRLVKS